jgi:hypothetical protein
MSLKDKVKDLLNAKTKSPEQIAKKHRVPLDYIMKQLESGMKVEREHTNSDIAAREIALDHLGETPHYYKKLKKIEG